MKKVGISLLVLFLALALVACGSPKVEEKPEKAVEEVVTKIKEPEKKETPKEVKQEPPQAEEEQEEPPPPIEQVGGRQIWYEFYDPLGKSHSALIEDGDFLQRINAILDAGTVEVEDTIPDLGGAAMLLIVENGESRNFVFNEITKASREILADEEPVSIESGGRVLGMGDEWYAMPDVTLEKELHDAYYKDQYKAEPEDSYQMSLSFGYIDVVTIEGGSESNPIIGTMARVELDNKKNEEDIARIQQVLTSTPLYPGTPQRTREQAGDFLSVEISENGTFTSFAFLLQPDGSLVYQMTSRMDREGGEADPAWHSVADASLYTFLLSTYFPNEPV